MKNATLCIATVMLTGMALVSRCHHPTPSAAAVEVMAEAATDENRKIMKELVAAFDRAEVAVQHADLDALMLFYANGYNYHGLKHADVRRVWSEVFDHYRDISSKHVFTELRLERTGRGEKASVTCTGGLYGMKKNTGKPITIDSWVNEVHFLVKENGEWKFQGNAGGTAPAAPPSSAPHHPLF